MTAALRQNGHCNADYLCGIKLPSAAVVLTSRLLVVCVLQESSAPDVWLQLLLRYGT